MHLILGVLLSRVVLSGLIKLQTTTMEKRINNDSLKDHNSTIGARSTTNGFIKDSYSWENSKSSDQDSLGDGGDLVGGFSWPPRSYTCTFCKREFRSAQALGGHMNVHRRDRARLRQMPSSQTFSSSYTLLNLNLHPNPKPNPNLSSYFSSSTSPTMLPPLISSSSPSTTHPSYCLCPRGGANLTTMKSQIPPFGVCKYDGFSSEKEGKIAKKSDIVRLNLEIGLLGESKSDDLDLELRLGCS